MTDAPGRHKLIAAGMKLFAERGFAAASVRDIASEAGVSIGLIRTHFGSKDGLRAAIDEHVAAEVALLYETVLEHSGTVAWEHVVEDAAEWLERDRDAVLYLRTALMERTPGSQALLERLLDLFRRFVAENRRRGFLQDGVDDEWASIYMFFDFLGPAILEPFADDVFGASMYTPDMISRRNRFMRRLMTRGFLKA